jgi:hypothetical protein
MAIAVFRGLNGPIKNDTIIHRWIDAMQLKFLAVDP